MRDFFLLGTGAPAEGGSLRFDDGLPHCGRETGGGVLEGFAEAVDDYLALLASLGVGVGLVETARASSNAAPPEL